MSKLITGAILTLLRAALGTLLVLSFAQGFSISLSAPLTTIGIFLGALIGRQIALSRLTPLGIIVLHLVAGIMLSSVFAIMPALPLPSAVDPLRYAIILTQLALPIILFVYFSASTCAISRQSIAATLELAAIVIVIVYGFSGHRGLQLDKPRFAVDLAWTLGFDAPGIFVALGAALIIGSLFYLVLCQGLYRSAQMQRHLPNTTYLLSARTHSAPNRIWQSLLPQFLSSILLIVIISVIGFAYYSTLSVTSGGQLSNGVGSGAGVEPGSSPLGFYSALGATQEPSAILRLDSDYSKSPFAPMLYLREKALSAMGDNEMVIADPQFDTDIPNTSIGQPFERKADLALPQRELVTQSVFTIARQSDPFAIDYPIKITPLANPSAGKFIAAYRSNSLAPTYDFNELSGLAVGNSAWSQDVLNHYLITHPDPRYGDKAREIVGEIKNPIDKARALLAYLSKNAIYTLQPNHKITPSSDPVSPFLFGDMRGYCVHFAHATVYMLRSLGIPSRIATGFLTDLSQSKDGHVLLRTSDRHAWAEVYVESAGWVPFDIQPEKVESHADTKVDSNLLEELMGLLEPATEILPPDTTNEGGSKGGLSQWQLPSIETIALLGLLFVLALGLGKLLLLQGWRLLPPGKAQARWLYQSMMARLLDLGLSRNYGETRLEYSERLGTQVTLNIPSISLPQVYSQNVYTIHYPHGALKNIVNAYASDVSALRCLPRRRRVIALLRLRSLIAWITKTLF